MIEEGRAELKYAIHQSQRLAVLRQAWSQVVADENAALMDGLGHLRDPDGNPPRGYLVSSLYVDDARFSGYAERLDSRRIRNRLRIRTYGRPGQRRPVFLEAKRKLDSRVIKHRVLVCDTEQWAELPGPRPWRATPGLCTVASAQRTARRWVQAVDRGAMGVVCRVEYLRETFVAGSSRLTLDHQVAAARTDDPHALRGPCPLALLPRDWIVLELKYNGSCPVWMRQLARSLRLQSEPISKFALGVAHAHRPQRAAELRHLTPPTVRRALRQSAAKAAR